MDEKAIADFIGITGSTRPVAIRLLGKAQGNVEMAIESFYNSTDEIDAIVSTTSQRSRSTVSRRGGGIASLGDLRERSEDDNDTNEYYVGGEKSGQMVQGGPPGGGQDVDALFEKAREAGAEVGSAADLGAPQSGRGGFQSFTGRGHTLTGISTDVNEPEPARGEEQAQVTRTVTFYANGVFTVDDGEPREMDDPANSTFMVSIMNGRCPPELMPEDPQTPININLVRREEEYVPPAEPKYRAFVGTAHKLTNDEVQEDVGGDDGGSETWNGPDESKPLTSIQIRLADGTRLVAKFNLCQTVGDIRSFVRVSRPELGSKFRLSASFPPKDLVDSSETIESAGLAGSVVMQK